MLPTELFALRKLRSDELKQIRIAKNITKESLAEKATISRKTIDRMESGKHSYGIDSEILYLNALETVQRSLKTIYGMG